MTLHDLQTNETLRQHEFPVTRQTIYLAHAGVCHAEYPMRIVRTKQSGTYFLACFAGEGRILVDGIWKKCGVGQACLLPPGILNAFHAVEGQRWHFAWVRYQQPPEQRPIVVSSSPVIAKFNCDAFRAAAEGLHLECSHNPLPATAHHWVELIQGYVLRFAQPWQVDDRLRRLWETVEADLGSPWTLDTLSGIAHVSSEHLRRLCRQALGHQTDIQ